MTKASHPSPVIGILYGGDMGSALARLCLEAGLRVVTTCRGRSSMTRSQAESSGMEILPDLDAVAEQSHIVFSLVLPGSAFEVAEQYAALKSLHPPGSIFVDANSIDLEQVKHIEGLMGEAGISFVDAAIHGTAQRLEELNLLYLSGARAGEVEETFRQVMRVSYLGEEAGGASRMKLIVSAMSKTLAAMFMEIGGLAEKSGMLEPFLETCRQFYPGILSTVERTLPTYPKHAARRADQLRDIEAFARSREMSPDIIHAAGERIDRVAAIDWRSPATEDQSLSGILRTVAQNSAASSNSNTDRLYEIQ